MGLLDGLPEVFQWDPLGIFGGEDEGGDLGIFDGSEESGSAGGGAFTSLPWLVPALVALVIVVLLLDN